MSATVLLRIGEVSRRLAQTDRTTWRHVKREGFPQPVRRGDRVFWIESEVEEYLRRVILESRGGHQK